MKTVFLLITLLFSSNSICQSDFIERWTNPQYDSLIALSTKNFDKLNFNVSLNNAEKAFNIRKTLFCAELITVNKSILNRTNVLPDKTLDNIIHELLNVADSCHREKTDCMALLICRVIDDTDTKIETTYIKDDIIHPIHCYESDRIFFKTVSKAEHYSSLGNDSLAAKLYAKATKLNRCETYPSEHLKSMGKWVVFGKDAPSNYNPILKNNLSRRDTNCIKRYWPDSSLMIEGCYLNNRRQGVWYT